MLYGFAPAKPAEPEIPDVDENDDKCVGRIERIRFHTGKTVGRFTYHITVIKLHSFKNEHNTEEELLRGALFKAFRAQSVIRIDSPTCLQSEIKFKGFSIITKGKKPQRFGKFESEVPPLPGNYCRQYLLTFAKSFDGSSKS